MKFDFDSLMTIFVVIFMVAAVIALLATPFVMYFNPCVYKTCIVWEQKGDK